MIHSLSGGILSENKLVDIAQVEILGDYFSGTFWFLSEIKNLKPNDVVVVPFGKQQIFVDAKVLAVKKNVSPQASPVPLKHLKKIVSLKNM